MSSLKNKTARTVCLYAYGNKASFHCRVQDCILFVLPACGTRNAYGKSRTPAAVYILHVVILRGDVQAGIKNSEAFKQAHDILIPLGEYFQVQDDYLDCYGDPEVIGKIGTDIKDNKCSWLINQALDKANPEQRRILDVRSIDRKTKRKK